MTDVHDWSHLVDVSGVMVSEPVLHSHFKKGPEPVGESTYSGFIRELNLFELRIDETSHLNRWIKHVLQSVLGFRKEDWVEEIPKECVTYLDAYDQVLKPNRVIQVGDEYQLAFKKYPAVKDGDKKKRTGLNKVITESGKWKASPRNKMERLLRETGIPFGLLTNGSEFILMHCPAGLATSSYTFSAKTMAEEKGVLEAFRMLAGRERFFGKETNRLTSLAQESIKIQSEVTDKLGSQVKDALEIFVNALSAENKDTGLLDGIEETEIYEMSLTVMMRLVFILYSEERGLLPHGRFFYDQGYGITHLWTELERSRKTKPELMKEVKDAWPRLLATFRIIHDGCKHDILNMKAYGGRLFDPLQFPTLERFEPSNEVIHNILQKLLFTKPRRGSVNQRVSYRSLDIEQIGSVYEGLMEYQVRTAKEDMVVFNGKAHEVRPKRELLEKKGKALVDYLKSMTGFTPGKIKNILEDPSDIEATRKGGELGRFNDFLKNSRISPGDVYLAHEGIARKGSGSYYTPKQLTSFLVKEALEPLVYDEDGVIKSPKEILDLNVCDPAMGSGAFLVQATNYLAEKLVESWDVEAAKHDCNISIPLGEPLRNDGSDLPLPENREEALVWARRFALENCIYGVDLNPLAVELAKMSLWLATLSRDKPFSFLDYKLRCGNSLIGSDFKDIDKIPSEALPREVRRQNEVVLRKMEQKTSRLDKMVQPSKLLSDFIKERMLLKETTDLNILSVREKQGIFAQITNKETSYFKLKTLMDLQTSVWFWPDDGAKIARPKKKVEGTKLFDFEGSPTEKRRMEERKEEYQAVIQWSPVQPHTGEYQEIGEYILTKARPKTISVDRARAYISKSRQVASEQRFFHWELEFPEVWFEEDGARKENGGFDAMVGNPPWEIVKPNSQEFYSVYDPDFRRYKKQKAVKVMRELQENNPSIKEEWDKYSKSIENQSFYIRKSDAYPDTGGGDINTYKVFVQKFHKSLRKGGISSIIIPSGIYTDKGTTELRKMFLEESQIKYLICFENREKIFDIHRSFKFVLFITQKGGPTEDFRAGFMLHDIEVLADIDNNTLKMNRGLIERFSPDTLSIMEFKSQKDIDIAGKIYGDWPLLGEELEGTWNVKFTREFDMTNDSHLFHTKEQLEKMGAKPDKDGRRWTGPDGERYLPLYEGKMIWQFNAYYDSPFNFWIHEDEVHAKLKKHKRTRATVYRFVYRAIGSSTNERSLVTAITPPYTTGHHNLTYDPPFDIDSDLDNKTLGCLFFEASLANSFSIDYIERLKTTIYHLFSFVYGLPVPRLTSGNYFFDQLVPRAARLISTTDEFADLWNEVYQPEWRNLGNTSKLADWKDITPEWSEKCGVYGWTGDKRDIGDRAQLRAEIDALVAHLYGLTEDEFAYILDTFPVLKKNEERAFGEFRSKRMCLEEYRRFVPIIEKAKKEDPKAFEVPKWRRKK